MDLWVRSFSLTSISLLVLPCVCWFLDPTSLGGTIQHLGSHGAGRWLPAFTELPDGGGALSPLVTRGSQPCISKRYSCTKCSELGGGGHLWLHSVLCQPPLELLELLAQREHRCCTPLGLSTCRSYAWSMLPSILSAWLPPLHASAAPSSGLKAEARLDGPRVGTS